jgi:hypothetical protein
MNLVKDTAEVLRGLGVDDVPSALAAPPLSPTRSGMLSPSAPGSARLATARTLPSGGAAWGDERAGAGDDDDDRSTRRGRDEGASHADMLADMGLGPASPSTSVGGASVSDAASFTPESAATAAAAAAAAATVAVTLDDVHRLRAWYAGPTLVGALDSLRPPPRAPAALERPLRLCISDVYRSPIHGLTLAGRIESGYLLPHTRLTLVPSHEGCSAKGISINGSPTGLALAGACVLLQA